jgi:hypothetical protein
LRRRRSQGPPHHRIVSHAPYVHAAPGGVSFCLQHRVVDSRARILSSSSASTRTWCFLPPTYPAMTLIRQPWRHQSDHCARLSSPRPSVIVEGHRERSPTAWGDASSSQEFSPIQSMRALALTTLAKRSHGTAVRTDGARVTARGWRRRHRRRRRCSTERRAGFRRFRVASPFASRLRQYTAVPYIAGDVLCTYA